jgi:indolepyruvate ferredoxin oxidoreductase alpha subunit
MTGHQGHPGTGISAAKTPVQKVDLEKLVRGIGIEDVSVVSAFDLAAIKSSISGAVENDGPSVVIVRGDCPNNVRTRKTPYEVDIERCVNCQACLRLGCPALRIGDDSVYIDTDTCIGCGVCAQICPKQCIVEISR